jgi:hypothetical protein
VHPYAKDKYEHLSRASDRLEEKADSIIKYLGGGTAIVALAAFAGITKTTAPIIGLLVPSIGCALAAVWHAVQARQPTKIPVPPRVDEAMSYVHAYKAQSEATFLAQWHEACVKLDTVVTYKAGHVSAANKFYFWTLAWLIIAMLVWGGWKLCCSASTKTDSTTITAKH